jgi:hypothetical protein
VASRGSSAGDRSAAGRAHGYPPAAWRRAKDRFRCPGMLTLRIQRSTRLSPASRVRATRRPPRAAAQLSQNSPTAFEAFRPRRLTICQTVDFAGAGGRLELPRPLGQQILSRATFALNCPGAIQKRPRGDRKTGIITQPFVTWTFETVSGQVHDRSKWVRVKNKPRAGP